MGKLEKDGVYLLYLRKSRADNPDESVEEVLGKHERLLQDYFEREIGKRIPEDCIYREIVSGGESLEERIEISKVLSRVEDKEVLGVACADAQRLSRGSLTDCDTLIDRLRFTNTLVITPSMTYNLENKMERRFFQDELMRGRDYLEYVKEVLWRGRCQSAMQGKFSLSTAPYGYDRIKIGKDLTLTPNDNADVVRMIFSWYVEDDLTPLNIADKLNTLGIKPMKKDKWCRETILHMLRNAHYDGKVVFCRKRMTTVFENGEKKRRRLNQAAEDQIIAEGKHPAIIDHQLFELAQAKLLRKKEEYAPKVKRTNELLNPFATILKCANCGRTMCRTMNRGEAFYVCRTRNCTKLLSAEKMTNIISNALLNVELPNLEAKAKNGEGQSLSIQKTLVTRLEKQMADYRAQEETQYELLETRKYTQEIFDKRNAILREKIDACQAQLTEAKRSLPDAVNYEEKLTTLKEAINALTNDEITAGAKNRLLKAVVSKIEYKSKANHGWGINDFSLEITLNL